jgi:PPP family 3-phenylpropionic acid transporter
VRARSLATRSRLTYAAFYAAVGAATPYLPLYYRHLGLDLGAIGLVVGWGSIVSLVAGPTWGLLSDRRAGSPWVFLAAAACGLVGAAALWLARDLESVLVAVVPFAAAFAGISPMLDARALELAGPERSGFGPQRAWGSISFVAVAFGTGVAVDQFGLGAAFVALVISLILTGALGLSLRVPRTASPATEVITFVPLGVRSALRALGTPTLALFLGGAFLAFTTLAGLNAFMSLRYAELGAAAAIIGSSWAVGAAVEVPIMLRFSSLAARIGVDRLVVAGVLIFSLRALGAALTSEPGVLVALTALGGVGYACFLVGGVTYVSLHAPRHLAATAQGLFTGAANALAQVTAGIVGGAIAGAYGLAGLFGACAMLGVIAAIVVALAIRIGDQDPRAGRTSEMRRSIVSSS